MPTEGDQAEQDRWVFDHAATWPDQIRGAAVVALAISKFREATFYPG